MVTDLLVHPDEITAPAGLAIAYGYMRVPRGIPDVKIQLMEERMRALATDHDLVLDGFFSEFECQWRTAFDDLLRQLADDLVRSRAGDGAHRVRIGVVIPTLRHLSKHPSLQEQMLQGLLYPPGAPAGADVEVFVLNLEERRAAAGRDVAPAHGGIPSARRAQACAGAAR